MGNLNKNPENQNDNQNRNQNQDKDIQGRDIFVLSEKDFYPPEDDRCYRSNVRSVYSGDTYDRYAKEFYRYYKECFDDMYEE